MECSPFRHRPGSLDRFIEGAGAPIEASEETAVASTADYPWQSAREDVQKLFNLRLPEKHLLMLRFIAEHTPDTMQKFCLKHLLPAIEKIAELTRTQTGHTPATLTADAADHGGRTCACLLPLSPGVR